MYLVLVEFLGLKLSKDIRRGHGQTVIAKDLALDLETRFPPDQLGQLSGCIALHADHPSSSVQIVLEVSGIQRPDLGKDQSGHTLSLMPEGGRSLQDRALT